MTSSVSKISITGGRGRLATLVARHFSQRGQAVSLFSRTESAGFRPLASLLEPTNLVASEILLHCAWSTLPFTSEQNPGSEWQADLPLLKSLLDGIVALPEQSRPFFVFFSSGGTVYGNAPGRPNREKDLCHPIGSYGRAKVEAEKLITAYGVRGLRFCILRVSNPYGHDLPASRPQGIISHALRCARTGETLTLWGDGSARKDYLYHTDFTAALDRVIECKPTGLYNLSSGVSYSVIQILSLVKIASGKKIHLSHSPAPVWDVHDSLLDSSKFSLLTGWKPVIDIKTGITRMMTEFC